MIAIFLFSEFGKRFFVLGNGDQSDIICNESRAAIPTVPVGAIQVVMSEMAPTDVISSVHFKHFGAVRLLDSVAPWGNETPGYPIRLLLLLRPTGYSNRLQRTASGCAGTSVARALGGKSPHS